ncbi:MAG: hypothetical protein M0Z50_12810 [Planctomycetia bacterium]|nr:hypothetical protein [Planctomycetia bacterium]
MLSKLDVRKKTHLIPLIVAPVLLGVSMWGFIGMRYHQNEQRQAAAQQICYAIHHSNPQVVSQFGGQAKMQQFAGFC